MVEWKRRSNLQAIVRILDFTSPMNVRELPIFLRFSSTMQIFYDAGHASCQHSWLVPPPLPPCKRVSGARRGGFSVSVSLCSFLRSDGSLCSLLSDVDLEWDPGFVCAELHIDGRPPPQLSRSQTAAGLHKGGESAELTLS